jgi:uncharacterized protein YicC (UPF0701 family)
VQHVVSSRSDCSPILLELECDPSAKITRTFRYEIMWEHEESLVEVIANAWQSASQVQTLGNFAGALRKVSSYLVKWSSQKFGSVTKELKQLREQMKEISESQNESQQEELHKLRVRMDEILYREEMMWLQRSRIAWLKEGDKNTKIFHMKVAG